MIWIRLCDQRSSGFWRSKGTNESTLGKDLSGLSIHQNLSDPGSWCNREIRFHSWQQFIESVDAPWSERFWMMVHQGNQWIYSRQWFVAAFDSTWSYWSWIMVHRRSQRFHSWGEFMQSVSVPQSKGSWIMVHKRNQWIHSRQWFVRVFDFTWSAWVILNYGASKEPMNLLWITIYCGLYSLIQHDPSDLESGTSKEPINRIWTRIHWAVHTPWVC